MSSFVQSMIMGAPTINRRPAKTAQWLLAASLGLGLMLSSSEIASTRYAGLTLTGAGCALLWLRHRKMQEALSQARVAQHAWQALMSFSQDGMTLLAPARDLRGHPCGYEVAQANAHAHTMLGMPEGVSLVGQKFTELLPEALRPLFAHRLHAARDARRPQIEEHALQLPGAGQATRWLHHQIIPIDGHLAVISRDITEVRQTIDALHEREAFYRTLVDCLPMPVYARSTRPSSAGEYVVWNKAVAATMQMPAEQVLGRKASDLLPPEVTRRGDELDLCVLREPRVHQFAGLAYPTPSGERIFDMIKAPVYGVDGEVDHILSIARDVTDQRRAAEQLKLASRVIDETGDAVVVTDAVDRVVMVNPAFLNLTGMSPAEVIGHSAELLGLPSLRESHLPGVTHALRSGQRWSGESHQVCNDGRTLDTWLSVSTLRNDLQKITQHIRVFSDISVLKAHQRELVEQARHDSLTGLPNRRAFGERLNQAMARARRDPKTLAVLFVDLDGFKAVNDLHGHAAGDQVLVEVAKRLLQSVRLTDCVCRLAGDEFTVILEGAGPAGEVINICQRILDRLCLPHQIGHASVIVSPSIGAAMYQAGESHEAMCQRADAAMYSAKHAGKAGFVLAQPESACDATPMLRQG
jgi:diguanylate cyclase (GGDEF)-like protein/PAS domain S-box-containing protein